MRYATIQKINEDSTVEVTFEGESETTDNVATLNSYTPVLRELVVALPVDDEWVVLGSVYNRLGFDSGE